MLLVLGLGLRLPLLWDPPRVVWDEIHFARYASGYLTGTDHFDIHPPLGKLLLAGALAAAGARPGAFDFPLEAEYPAGFPVLAGRLVPALAGGLLPLLVWAVAGALGAGPRAALLAGLLAGLDTAMVVESRYMLIDIFVPVLSLVTVGCFWRHEGAMRGSRQWWGWLLLSALAAGGAVSVKWTGAGAIAAIAGYSLLEALWRRAYLPLLLRGLAFAVIPAAVFLLSYAVHFRLLPPAPGAPTGFVERLTDLQRRQVEVNRSLPPSHRDASAWWSWPVLGRPITFRGRNVDADRLVVFLGNPPVWWFGTLALVAGVGWSWRRRVDLRRWAESGAAAARTLRALGFLLLLHGTNWLPFALIHRDMYAYHYLTALLASLLFGAIFLLEVAPQIPAVADPEGWARVLLAGAALGFVFLAPLVYGMPACAYWTVAVPALPAAAVLWMLRARRREQRSSS